MTRIILLLFILSSFVACKNDTTKGDTSANELYFGEKITADDAMSYETLLTTLSTQDSIEGKVRGKVDGVCQAKGCWMTIVSEEEGKPEMFVKFKDYGFFMPKDIAGQEVIVRGKAYRELTSVEELRHYAEDEGRSAEEIAEITEPEEELKFMADGVILLK